MGCLISESEGDLIGSPKFFDEDVSPLSALVPNIDPEGVILPNTSLVRNTTQDVAATPRQY